MTKKRVENLEAERKAWRAAHVRVSEVSEMLLQVLLIVGEEAGTATAGRVAGRIVGDKAQRVAQLTGMQR